MNWKYRWTPTEASSDTYTFFFRGQKQFTVILENEDRPLIEALDELLEECAVQPTIDNHDTRKYSEVGGRR